MSRLSLGCAVAGLVLTGCAAYQMGSRSLYAPDISTVYVPLFESVSYRRNLGERLTEAVVKEIELKSPYKVVGRPPADSILTGRIISDGKRVLTEDAGDEPRELELGLAVEVRWINHRGSSIRPPTTVRFDQTESLVPEVGQSVASAQSRAIQRLAEQIVATMEAPW